MAWLGHLVPQDPKEYINIYIYICVLLLVTSPPHVYSTGLSLCEDQSLVANAPSFRLVQHLQVEQGLKFQVFPGRDVGPGNPHCAGHTMAVVDPERPRGVGIDRARRRGSTWKPETGWPAGGHGPGLQWVTDLLPTDLGLH